MGKFEAIQAARGEAGARTALALLKSGLDTQQPLHLTWARGVQRG